MTRVDIPFHFIDVFAAEPLTGNPLALVPDADRLSTTTMRAIAREFNQSETTFIVAPTMDAAQWRLRSFTPAGVEVLGAGHNAMGAWQWLAASGRLPSGQREFIQQIGDDLLAVEVTSARDTIVVTMDQSAPSVGATLDDRAALASALGVSVQSFADNSPAQAVSTGVGHLLVPLASREAVDATRPDAAALVPLLESVDAEGCYVYALTADEGDPRAYARFFNPAVGIAEDPATGTAAGPLIANLVRTGMLADDATWIIEQGTALGRPSFLRVSIAGERVRLSGSGVITASGVLHLDLAQ